MSDVEWLKCKLAVYSPQAPGLARKPAEDEDEAFQQYLEKFGESRDGTSAGTWRLETHERGSASRLRKSCPFEASTARRSPGSRPRSLRKCSMSQRRLGLRG